MIILGVDPGTRTTGYGLIEVRGHHLSALDFGTICPPQEASSSRKYRIIFDGVEALIKKHQPQCVVVETQFMYKNAKSFAKLVMARSMAMLATERAGCELVECTPKQAKKAVGTGSASKENVQKMVQILLKLPVLPEPEDAADALALAIWHANGLKFKACLTTSTGTL